MRAGWRKSLLIRFPVEADGTKDILFLVCGVQTSSMEVSSPVRRDVEKGCRVCKLLPGRFGRSDWEEEMMPTAEVTGSIR